MSRQAGFWIVLWLAIATAAVLIYNGWILLSGHGSWHDLMHIPYWGGPLLAANLLAGATLGLLWLKNSGRHDPSHCEGCCSSAGSDWEFCPLCGTKRSR